MKGICPYCNKRVWYLSKSQLIPDDSNPGGFVALALCPHCGEGVKYVISKRDRYFNLLLIGPTALYLMIYRFLNLSKRIHVLCVMALGVYFVIMTIYSVKERSKHLLEKRY